VGRQRRRSKETRRQRFAPALTLEVDVRRAIPLICVCLLLTTAASALAQEQRLFAVMRSEVVELDPRAASLGTVLRRFPVPANASPQGANVMPFGGGEFLAWTQPAAPWARSGAIFLLNTHSGVVQQFTFPDFVPGGIMGTDGNARLLVSGLNGSGLRKMVLVADARSGSTRLLDVGRNGDYQAMAYAAGSDVLFVARPMDIIFGQPQPPRLVDVIHASTGTLLKTLDISPHIPSGLSTNAAGTRLFVNTGAGTFVFDAVSGAQLASNTSSQALQALGAVTLDEYRNRLLVSPIYINSGEDSSISAFTADSLQFIGKVPVPELPLPPRVDLDDWPSLRQRIDTSAQSATLFVLQAVNVAHEDYYVTNTCHESQLIALEADTGRVRRTVSTTATLGDGACTADLVRITEPAPPSAPTADVSGHRLTLRWQAALGATRYQIEAGSAPGLSNLATISVTDPQLVVDGVPSGVYHLRVRAINTIGKSGASQDIKVIVP
jgi:hypothetical protein